MRKVTLSPVELDRGVWGEFSAFASSKFIRLALITDVSWKDTHDAKEQLLERGKFVHIQE